MSDILLDPTDKVDRGQKAFAPRLDTLDGVTIGLLDINKAKGVHFLDRIEEVLRTRYGVKEVLRRKKVSPGRLASEQIHAELREKCDAVIEALSDWGGCISCSSHDVVKLEENGIPTANVATTEFIAAAHAQCSALGMSQYEPIFVSHPIQPKTPEEVRALADQVVEQVVTKLLKQKVQQAA